MASAGAFYAATGGQGPGEVLAWTGGAVMIGAVIEWLLALAFGPMRRAGIRGAWCTLHRLTLGLTIVGTAIAQLAFFIGRDPRLVIPGTLVLLLGIGIHLHARREERTHERILAMLAQQREAVIARATFFETDFQIVDSRSHFRLRTDNKESA
jgi:hypothetical protein